MNRDIRILVSFKNHRKRKRLKMVLGESGTDYLIDLWLTAAEDRPDGVLFGWDEVDIAISCGWDGEPQKIIQALVETKWLDTLEDGTYILHDWVEHNGYASSAVQRSDKARFSNLKRWHPGIAKQLSTQGIDALTADQFKSITDGKSTDKTDDRSPIGTDSGTDSDTESIQNPPAPAPSPAPAIRNSVPDGTPVDTTVSTPPSPCPHEKIRELYNQLLPELPTCKNRNKSFDANTRARWKEDKNRQNLDWWRNLFQEIRQSDFLMGRTDKPFNGCSLDWIVRPTNLTKILNGNYKNRNGGKRNGAQKNRDTGHDDRQPILPECHPDYDALYKNV